MKLFVYDHCPFCVKAKMIFGLKNIPVELVHLLNDDGSTPISMVGQKMLPILQKDNGEFMPESLDIIHYVDTLDAHPIIASDLVSSKIHNWLEENSRVINLLRMPRMVKLPFPEFATDSAKEYFIHKKESYFGPFEEALVKTDKLLVDINNKLPELAECIQSEEACNGQLSEDDFHLFAGLHGLSMVKGIVYPEKLEGYRKTMSSLCKIDLCDNWAV